MKYTRKSRAPAAKSRAVQAQIQCIQMCFSSHFYYDSSYLNGIDRKGPHSTPLYSRPYKDTERFRQQYL